MTQNHDQILSKVNLDEESNKIEKNHVFLKKEEEFNEQKKVILYTAPDGKITANVFFAQENFWITQKTMAELFGVNIPAISKHLKNIYATNELTEDSTISKMEIVQ